MRFNENEEAVSPVIGVILMVAITVILAAVIAVFVFGMADGIQTSHTVAATSKISGDNVTVTYQGGADHQDVQFINASVTGAGDPGDDPTKNYLEKDKTDVHELAIGSIIEIKDGAKGSRLLVTAQFSDGATQVLIDKQI